MDCPRCTHNAYITPAVLKGDFYQEVWQWHCTPCGWRDDAWRSRENLIEREQQRNVVRIWFAQHDHDGRAKTAFHNRYIAPNPNGKGEDMSKGAWSPEARLKLHNRRRAEKGLEPLASLPTNGNGHTNGNGYKDLHREVFEPPDENLTKPVDEFIPGQFVGTSGPMQLIPLEVKFSIGRTAQDWANFLTLWKTDYPNFRLDHAQSFEEQGSQMRVALSAIPKEEA